ncbi:MAG: DUF5723 family protein, partial [Marinirhabdus sp.]
MKKWLPIVTILWLYSGFAQNKQVLYGFDQLPQTLLLNPGAEFGLKKHFGIPLLSQIHVNAGTSGISAFDIFQVSNTGDINQRIRQKIFELTEKDFLTATQQLEVFNFGWRRGDNTYLSGGMYQEFDFIFYYPRDAAILTMDGNAPYIGREFDLAQAEATADVLTVYHFGINRKVSKKLTLGARAKIYSSIVSGRSVGNSATFVTNIVAGSPNIYEHTVTADYEIQSSGIANAENANSFIKRAFFGGSVGLGADVGATYKIKDNITATASLLDVGAIFHTSNVENYTVQGSYTTNGIEILFEEDEDGNPIPYFDDLKDALEEALPFDTNSNSYTQMRPMQAHASLEYSFGRALRDTRACNCRNSLRDRDIDSPQRTGIQMYTIKRPKGLISAATLFYSRKFSRHFAAKATYTIDPYSSSNVGLGISATLGKFNMYMAADNLLRYTN